MVRVAGGRSPHNMIISGFRERGTLSSCRTIGWIAMKCRTGSSSGSSMAAVTRSAEYWKHPFIKDARILSWDDAMTEFRDATGRPGPSTGKLVTTPRGRMTIQSAESVGTKRLRIVNSRAGVFPPSIIGTVPRLREMPGSAHTFFHYSNFAGRGPARTGSLQGMSRSGTYDLAGNVKEWSWNEAAQRKRYILGGAWNEPAVHVPRGGRSFSIPARPCVRIPLHEVLDSLSRLHRRLTEPVIAAARNYAKEQPASEKVFRVYRETCMPTTRRRSTLLSNPRDTREADWIKQKITLDAAYGNERMATYLFLPQECGSAVSNDCSFSRGGIDLRAFQRQPGRDAADRFPSQKRSRRPMAYLQGHL